MNRRSSSSLGVRSTASPQAASVKIADAAEMHRMDLSNVGPPLGGPLLTMSQRAPPAAPFRTLLAGSVHVCHRHCPDGQAGNNQGCDLAKFHRLLTPEQEAVSATYATVRLVASTTAAARRAAAAKKKAPGKPGQSDVSGGVADRRDIGRNSALVWPFRRHPARYATVLVDTPPTRKHHALDACACQTLSEPASWQSKRQ